MGIYQFSVNRVNGKSVELSQYKGKVILIVNTASKCAFTPQFDDLQKLYNNHKGEKFEILGLPCNQFGEQEPGSSQEAASFCHLNYGVTFPVFAKVEVNGADAHPLFKYLKENSSFRGFDDNNFNEKLLKMMIFDKNPEWLSGNEIKWNFTKFLIDQEGNVVKRYEPTDEISDISKDIEQLLGVSV